MGFLRKIRHSRILKQRLLDEESWTLILQQHPIFDRLSAGERARLRELVTLFLHDKVFEGADGLDLDESMRGMIAAQACLPILNLPLECYDGLRTIVVVPNAFKTEYTRYDEAGVAHEWRQTSSAEAHHYGTVTLSWQDVRESGQGEGYNVVIHEAAHHLDSLDGGMNGRPALHSNMSPQEWLAVFSRALEDYRLRTYQRRKRKFRFDDYGTTDDAEFFAVMSEYFFEKPRVLRSEYPDVYRLLSAFYLQDPVGVSTPR
jgi:Mlc titration factor MtfA (ptsG expression regulator)